MTSSQPFYSDDEHYFLQNEPPYNTNQRKNHWNDIKQPDDIFEPEFSERYMNIQQPNQHNNNVLKDNIWHNLVITCNLNITQKLKVTNPNL